jgi:hypothetical protein
MPPPLPSSVHRAGLVYGGAAAMAVGPAVLDALALPPAAATAAVSMIAPKVSATGGAAAGRLRHTLSLSYDDMSATARAAVAAGPPAATATTTAGALQPATSVAPTPLEASGQQAGTLANAATTSSPSVTVPGIGVPGTPGSQAAPLTAVSEKMDAPVAVAATPVAAPKPMAGLGDAEQGAEVVTPAAAAAKGSATANSVGSVGGATVDAPATPAPTAGAALVFSSGVSPAASSAALASLAVNPQVGGWAVF